MGVGNVNFGKTMTERPRVMNGLASVHHDYERAFTTEEVDEELKEGIYGKGLGFCQ